MVKIYNLKDKKQYLREVAILEHNEWASNSTRNFESRIENKCKKIEGKLNKQDFCKLILVDGEKLIGFISIFPHDCDGLPTLSPWYATMYVKREYRGKGYSKILNDAILEEAKKRNYREIYLKSELKNYYEKFGAIYIKNINEKEKLYKFNLY